MRTLPSLTYTAGAGAVSNDYSSIINAQLYDSDDVAWNIRDFIAEAEL